MSHHLSATMEDYLEAIHQLKIKEPVVRVKDIAEYLKVKMPSVTSALNTLRNDKLIEHDRYGHVELTTQGREIAEEVHRRHVILVNFLTDILQLAPEQAQLEACELEHGLTPETLRRLMGLLDFVGRCPRSSGDWLEHMRGRWEDRDCDHNCSRCVQQIALPHYGPFRGGGRPESGAVPLGQQQPGFKGMITHVRGHGPIRRRLMEMGVTRGTEIEFERVAPLGDPLEVKLRGYHLTLRREEADHIFVTATPEDSNL